MEHIKAWNNEHKSNLWKGHYSLELLEPYSEKGRLLDAGCGCGKYSQPLKMRGFEVVAVDVSSCALKTASKSSRARKLDIDFLAANIYDLPFSGGSFDIIWCYGVLQHLLLKEREAAICEFKRLLRSGGLLFIEVFGVEDMRYGGCEVEPGTFKRKNGIVYHYFDKQELTALLLGFGCEIVESMKEKRFDGRLFTRHMISVVAKKS
ncbi:MAG: class I SAM-dependent methyltransferase [Candidatus Methanoperedens sp.]|nr:class I SAM-dependent methyltransferase [Candidatus Methanoperedens sp.]MCZ7371073.1 class I SAM-dependent methyltransferase [Candidatus Methanoperedens sp.]